MILYIETLLLLPNIAFSSIFQKKKKKRRFSNLSNNHDMAINVRVNEQIHIPFLFLCIALKFRFLWNFFQKREIPKIVAGGLTERKKKKRKQKKYWFIIVPLLFVSSDGFKRNHFPLCLELSFTFTEILLGDSLSLTK